VTAAPAPSPPAARRAPAGTEDHHESGRAYLELADATPAEAERGIAALRKVMGC
jgi:hypothetical protein